MKKEQLLRLIRQADILVQNFPPGSLDRKELSYADLPTLNPRLIYCSIRGYGQSGPRCELPCYDYIAQAESGLMSITREMKGEPLPVGSPIEDVSTGMYACIAILAALRAREQTSRAGFPSAPINTVRRALRDEQLAARG